MMNQIKVALEKKATTRTKRYLISNNKEWDKECSRFLITHCAIHNAVKNHVNDLTINNVDYPIDKYPVWTYLEKFVSLGKVYFDKLSYKRQKETFNPSDVKVSMEITKTVKTSVKDPESNESKDEIMTEAVQVNQLMTPEEMARFVDNYNENQRGDHDYRISTTNVIGGTLYSTINEVGALVSGNDVYYFDDHLLDYDAYVLAQLAGLEAGNLKSYLVSDAKPSDEETIEWIMAKFSQRQSAIQKQD